MLPRLAALTAASLVLIAGCTSGGGSDDDKGSSKPSATASAPPTGPDCAEIWKKGATLPADYTKCVTDGAYGLQDVTKCQDGTRLVAFADQYYAITGGRIDKPEIAPMQDTKEFSTAYAACTGE